MRSENSESHEMEMKIRRYLVFLAVLLAMIVAITYNNNFLLAPPYAVTAYLLVFERESKFSKAGNIAASYIFVIISSEAIHLTLGISASALVLNLVAVSLFISFTKYSHPPALALTIFSYIAHNSVEFTITSFVVLAIAITADVLIKWSHAIDSRDAKSEHPG
ncbi:MAG: HPP family protein [Thermoplasmata archaeon]|uniref:HPP family protein n=1 Tax=Candidatus Sysuiplasma superficiale TaxID=2823368 RepID=A0A8J7YN91_9ARCH|nr:HPP family protein [Candidatus Sysuiplasma superficiale]MBX8643458.1 HPP family protein [Candidatus Sysuiplasma superficiale]MCL4347236.1 HPP family protein [Candidatus Thermoplasmatota archaeon]